MNAALGVNNAVFRVLVNARGSHVVMVAIKLADDTVVIILHHDLYAANTALSELLTDYFQATTDCMNVNRAGPAMQTDAPFPQRVSCRSKSDPALRIRYLLGPGVIAGLQYLVREQFFVASYGNIIDVHQGLLQML